MAEASEAGARIGGIVLAAGEGRRFGGRKQQALKAGVAALGELDAAVVLLADQPLVTAAAIERVVAARRPGAVAVRATYGGKPGHPVLLERDLFGGVAALSGDAGARGLLEAHAEAVVEIRCDDVADPLDVDHPSDLRVAEARLQTHRHG